MEKKNKIILLILFIGVLMGALDISIVGPAIPSIEKNLGIERGDVGWIFSIYVLFSLIGVSLFARLSDKKGRRNIYTIAVLIFGIGSLWVALSKSLEMILIGRAIQGFGASGIFPVASAVIGDIYPKEKRGRMLGLIGAVFGIAFILGPIIAGVLLSYFDWNVLFLINVPLVIILIFGSLKYLPSKKNTADFKIDWSGIILLTAFLATLTLSLESIGNYNANGDINIWPFAGLIISFLFLILLIFVESQVDYPILNISYFGNRQIVIAGILAIGTGFFQAAFVFFPKFTVEAYQVSSANASFLLIPLVLASAIGSPIFGRLIDKFGSRKIILLAMVLLVVSFFIQFLFIEVKASFIIGGVLVGLAFSILSGSSLRYIMLNETPVEERATSQGFITIFVSIGQIVNAIIISTILKNQTSMLSGFKIVFMYMFFISIALLVLAFFLKPRESKNS